MEVYWTDPFTHNFVKVGRASLLQQLAAPQAQAIGRVMTKQSMCMRMRFPGRPVVAHASAGGRAPLPLLAAPGAHPGLPGRPERGVPAEQPLRQRCCWRRPGCACWLRQLWRPGGCAASVTCRHSASHAAATLNMAPLRPQGPHPGTKPATCAWAAATGRLCCKPTGSH